MRRVPTRSRTRTSMGKDALAWMPLPLRGDRTAQHRLRPGRGGGAEDEAGWRVARHGIRMGPQPLAADGVAWLRGLRAHGKRVAAPARRFEWHAFQTLQFPAYLGRLCRPFFFRPPVAWVAAQATWRRDGWQNSGILKVDEDGGISCFSATNPPAKNAGHDHSCDASLAPPFTVSACPAGLPGGDAPAGRADVPGRPGPVGALPAGGRQCAPGGGGDATCQRSEVHTSELQSRP